jgi:hypothetical protein
MQDSHPVLHAPRERDRHDHRHPVASHHDTANKWAAKFMAIFAIARWIGMSIVASGEHGHFFVLGVDVELLGRLTVEGGAEGLNPID